MRVPIALLTLALLTQEHAMSAPVIAPAPAEEALSEFYALRVDGQAVPVYACRVSAQPFNQVWPGYQRPLDQTELAGFALWDQGGPVTITIESRRPITKVVARPRRLGIVPQVQGQTITFTLARPEPVVVEVNGMHHALHLLPSPPESDVPQPEGVRYFGPGVHHPGVIELKSNETVYLAPGAVVYGSLHGSGVSNVRITGRGILDQSPFERGKGGGSIRLSDCANVRIEGLVLRDPDVWCLSLFGCRDITLRGLKLVGLWRYNADGIDVCNSQNVTVEDCFVRAYDDALVVKGLKWGGNSFDDRPVRDVTFRRNTLWCDWGRAMEIGAETCAPEMTNVRFEDSDIIFTTHIAMDIQHGDRAAIRDVRFERIRVEMDGDSPRPAMQQAKDERYQPADGYLPTLAVIVINGTSYSQDKQRGTVRGVVFRDIDIWVPRLPASSFRGADAEHGVDDVTCSGWRLNGQPLGSLEALGIRLGEHVRSVRYSSGAPE
ncbi:MAG: hypothetical protein HZB16_08810 [Armatimonadetes bacterium]|nr:hypothetical protein [Armatimonadota bacterium]